MQANQKVIEIVGTPGKTWGNVIVPASGTVTLQITGDLIQATTQNGFEKTTSWTRIQNIDSIEIAEAPNYLLLLIGIVFALMGLAALVANPVSGLVLFAIGVVCIVYALKAKRRLLVIHSFRYTIPVFMTKPPDLYRQFAANVMTLARQLNTFAPGPQPNRPAQARPNNTTAPQSTKAK